MRLGFLGSSAFAVPALRRLAASAEVAAVITRPDRPAGRGRSLRSPPVRIEADRLGLPCLQPKTVKSQEAIAHLKRLNLDGILVAAYGELLPPALLGLPRRGCLNLHASLLPRWRGAAPVQAAIRAGDQETGVSLMHMDEGMDTGPVAARLATAIGPGETAGQLEARLADLGAELLAQSLPRWEEGALALETQDEEKATYAPRLRKDSGRLDFARPAQELERQVRAFEPWPGSYFTYGDVRIRVRSASVVETGIHEPGHATQSDGYPVVGTPAGGLRLDSVQPAGKRIMSGQDFLRGARHFLSARLVPARGATGNPAVV